MKINSGAPDAAFKKNMINGWGTEDDSFHVLLLLQRRNPAAFPVGLFVVPSPPRCRLASCLSYFLEAIIVVDRRGRQVEGLEGGGGGGLTD